jgi:hypothetical protein
MKKEAIWTPWGYADYEEDWGTGIKFYNTPSHGGLKVPNELNNQIPEYMRRKGDRKGGWYEEDVDWCIPIITLPFYISKDIFVEKYPKALKIMKSTLWREYEKYFGIELKEGESYFKDRAMLIKKHRNDMIVVSSLSDENGMVKCWAIKGGRREDFSYASREGNIYLVPKEEYEKRNKLVGFIIDENKHQKIGEWKV